MRKAGSFIFWIVVVVVAVKIQTQPRFWNLTNSFSTSKEICKNFSKLERFSRKCCEENTGQQTTTVAAGTYIFCKHLARPKSSALQKYNARQKIDPKFYQIFLFLESISWKYHAGQKLDPKFWWNSSFFCVSKLKVKYSFFPVSWKYWVDFHVSKLKVKIRTSFMPTSSKTLNSYLICLSLLLHLKVDKNQEETFWCFSG